ncbi:uncharacterized protein TNCV_1989461 [Trichonephila clavipes]|nr:uncharacterized protein TNCV_1989461 [Trichonephila clavipes]
MANLDSSNRWQERKEKKKDLIVIEHGTSHHSGHCVCREETHCHVFSRGLINVGNYLGNGKGAILFYANVPPQTMAGPAVGQEDVDVTRTLKRGTFFPFFPSHFFIVRFPPRFVAATTCG